MLQANGTHFRERRLALTQIKECTFADGALHQVVVANTLGLNPNVYSDHDRTHRLFHDWRDCLAAAGIEVRSQKFAFDLCGIGGPRGPALFTENATV